MPVFLIRQILSKNHPSVTFLQLCGKVCFCYFKKKIKRSMKKFLLSCYFLILASGLLMAQSVSNSAVLIQNLGYASGVHALQIHTLQSCSTEIRFRYAAGTADTIVTMAGNTYQVIKLSDPRHQQNSVSVKTSTNCSGGTSATWIDLDLSVTVLPVHVLSFSGRKTSTGIMLTYTLDLSGGAYVELQRSTDGTTWKRIAVIRDPANHYTLDLSCEGGKNYYRLKLFDGSKISYSTVILVQLQERTTATAKYFTLDGMPLGDRIHAGIAAGSVILAVVDNQAQLIRM
jgi:hypothetical protein